MKFDYAINVSQMHPEYHFAFTLTQDEVNRVLHKYGNTANIRSVLEGVNNLNTDKMQFCLRLLQGACTDDGKDDLGIDYKKKYEELVELLTPYKIDDMSPKTTLKMLLKYNK